ncbi:nickel transporter ATP-binding protein NikE [Rubripirellula tenax]|uniref:Nickel transporter ATP-binding protein NikE n=1 Tax=Rubripirellula tenax TaxID=2528015 RepID=A0A5C6F8L6_9BACT|nr:hypothetical protein [Rubripirellula tenax]TWU56707.1 nickel transporter ATP-binding protein NikE [Rubripirellula tenax]
MKESETSTVIVNKPRPKVLELRSVTLSGKTERTGGLLDVSLLLREGEMAMIHMERSQSSRAAASMIQGLTKPYRGDVLFQDSDWQGNDFSRHFRMRSRIGRVFDGQAWIANLNINDNLTLAGEHHGRDHKSMHHEIALWSKQFSVDPASRERPAFVEPSRLQIFQWVRALSCHPSLLILERPMRSVATTWLPALVRAVEKLRRRGTAVVWFAGSAAEASDDLSKPVLHFRWVDERLHPIADLTRSPSRSDVDDMPEDD